MAETDSQRIRRLADTAIEAITDQTGGIDAGVRWAIHAEIARRLLSVLVVERDRLFVPAEVDLLTAAAQCLSERARLWSAKTGGATGRQNPRPV